MITLHKYELSGNIKDRYVTLGYHFDFENFNQYGSNQLRFEITIHPNAFISKFEAIIDGQLFIGKTKEKETASQEYSEAKEKNENAILISQVHENIPNVFQIKTNIDAKSKIYLTIEIEQYLQKKFDFNQLNIQILRNFSRYNIIQNLDHISFKLLISDNSGIYNINIPMIHESDIIIDEQIMDKMDQKCQINGKIMCRSSINELIVKYKTKGEQCDSYILFDNKSNTFCHIISDVITDSIITNEEQNTEIKNDILIPRRVLFVIDRSKSMRGIKWEKTITATITAIKQLKKGCDRFGIILFDHKIVLLQSTQVTDRCIMADNKSVSDAITALQNANVKGGTNINKALLKAIELIKNDIMFLNNECKNKYNFFMNQLILITDGKPNRGECNTNKILMNVKNANRLETDKYSNNKTSIFSFGVGSDSNTSDWIYDLNHSFLKMLSVNNNGFYQRIKQSAANVELAQYFNILSKPVLLNINVEYKNKNITDVTKTKFNAIYTGNDLIICGKIKNDQNEQKINDCNLLLSISAITGKQIKENDKLITKPIHISKQMKVNINKDIYNTEVTSRIWAYLKLQQLATKKLIHNDMIEMDEYEKKENDLFPLALALKYKFVTPWTSMIVVKKKKDIGIIQNENQSRAQSHHLISTRNKGVSLSRDQLISKILAPIASESSKQPLDSNDTSDDTKEYDLDQLFPDFHHPYNTTVASDSRKKAWKSIRFQYKENATISSETELKNHIIIAPPKQMKNTKKKKKNKKKNKRKDMAIMSENSNNNYNIELIAEISDRLDCLLNVCGEIIKYQIVGCLSLKCDEIIKGDKYFYATISNLENTRVNIFNPLIVQTLDGNGKIRIKLTNNENHFGILKYTWNTNVNDIKQTLPFSVELKTENNEHNNVFIVCCIIKPKNDNIYLMNEFVITGTVKHQIIKCIEHTKLNNIDFIWKKEESKKFVWCIKNTELTDIESNTNEFMKHICDKDRCIVFGYIRQTDLKDLCIPTSIVNYCILYAFGIKQYTLIAKFKSTTYMHTNTNKAQLKITFRMNNIGISNIRIDVYGHTGNTKCINNTNIIKTIKNIHSGEFIVR